MDRKLIVTILLGICVFLPILIVSSNVIAANIPPDDVRWLTNLSRAPSASSDAEFDYAPQIVASGNIIHVTWQSTDYSGNRRSLLYYARSTDQGNSWEKKVLLEAPYSEISLGPMSRWMAVDGSNVHIFVGTYGYPSTTLYYYRSTDSGANFEPPKVIDTAYYWSFYSLYASAANGNVIIAYHKCFEDDNGSLWDGIIVATSSNNGQNFSYSTAIKFPSYSSGGGSIIDMQTSDNRIFILTGSCYGYYGYGALNLYVSSSLDFGQTFLTNKIYEPPSSVNSPLCRVGPSHNDYYSPRIAVDGNKVYVAYLGYNSSGKIAILFRRSVDSGTTFQSEIDLSQELPAGRMSLCDLCRLPEFTIAAKRDKVYVLFRDNYSYYGYTGNLYLKRSLNGGDSFYPIQELTTPADPYTSYLPAAVSQIAHPYMILDPRDPSGSKIFILGHGMFFTYSTDSGANFSGPVALFDFTKPYGGGYNAYVHAAIDNNGTIHMVTPAYNFVENSDIYYRVIHSKAPRVQSSSNWALSMTMYNGYPERYDAMLIPSSPDLEFGSALSVEAWIRVKGLRHSRPGLFLGKYLDSNYSYYMGIDYYKYPHVKLMTTEGYVELSASGQVFPDDKWTHFAMTYDSSLPQNNLKIYINGFLVAQKTARGNVVNTRGPLIIGGKPSIYGSYGQSTAGNLIIDELRFWNRALNEDEIRRNMNRNLTGIERGLVGYFNFNEPFNKYGMVRDITMRGNDGYLIQNEALVSGVRLLPREIVMGRVDGQ